MINKSPFYFYSGKVTNVVDGDTFDVLIDLGFQMSWSVRVRLFGVNAPEMKTVEGPAAKDYLAGLIADKEIVFYSLKDRKETYGRYLAIAYVGTKEVYDTSKSINKLILESGNGSAKYISAKDLPDL